MTTKTTELSWWPVGNALQESTKGIANRTGHALTDGLHGCVTDPIAQFVEGRAQSVQMPAERLAGTMEQ